MPNRFLPQGADNAYRGNAFAPWLLAIVVLLKAYVGLDCILNGRFMASAGDRIPLDSFTADGARTVVSLLALWGFSHLLICGVCLVALARYRTLVPLMFALLLLEHLGRMLVLHLVPLAQTGPGGESVGVSPVPYGFLVMIGVGLALSLWVRGDPKGRE